MQISRSKKQIISFILIAALAISSLIFVKNDITGNPVKAATINDFTVGQVYSLHINDITFTPNNFKAV